MAVVSQSAVRLRQDEHANVKKEDSLQQLTQHTGVFILIQCHGCISTGFDFISSVLRHRAWQYCTKYQKKNTSNNNHLELT